jgi:hypothetical protein
MGAAPAIDSSHPSRLLTEQAQSSRHLFTMTTQELSAGASSLMDCNQPL